MRVVFAGTPEPALPTLEALVGSRHEVVGVVTRPDARTGRGRRLAASPVGTRAAELGIEVVKPASARAPEFVEWLTAAAPDLVVVVAYGALIPLAVLQIPPHGFVNVHFSLLPAWRGAAPVQRALMAGETHAGVTVFELVPELDAGPTYRARGEAVGEGDTAGSLLTRLADVGAELLLETLDAIEAGEQPVPQPDDGVSLAPKVQVDEARIDWGETSASITHLVRGTNPAPGAWTTLDGERFKVLAATPASVGVDGPLAPGELRATRRELLVGTGDGALDLTKVQPFGKKPMAGADWARGVQLDQARFV